MKVSMGNGPKNLPSNSALLLLQELTENHSEINKQNPEFIQESSETQSQCRETEYPPAEPVFHL